MSFEIKRPFYCLIEDYLVKIFRIFNSKISTDYEVKIYNGRQAGNFINEVEDSAIFNLYADSVAPNKAYNTGYRIDTVTFHIDIFVAPTCSGKLFKEIETQDEVAHKFLLLYSHYADKLISDLSIRLFGFDEPFITNYRFCGIKSFENQYNEAEIRFLGSKLIFTLDIPFLETDAFSTAGTDDDTGDMEYNRLSQIIINISNDEIDSIFNCNKE